jgi:hypothetical protein
LYGLAAAQGYSSAYYSLGYVAENGLGVPVDVSQAIEWYQLACLQADGDFCSDAREALHRLQFTCNIGSFLNGVSTYFPRPRIQRVDGERHRGSDEPMALNAGSVELSRPAVHVRIPPPPALLDVLRVPCCCSGAWH